MPLGKTETKLKEERQDEGSTKEEPMDAEQGSPSSEDGAVSQGVATDNPEEPETFQSEDEAMEALAEAHKTLGVVLSGITAISRSNYELYHRLRKDVVSVRGTLDKIPEVRKLTR